MRTKTITARIDDTVNNEIEYIKSSFGLTSTTSVLTYAIHILYTSMKEKQSQKSSLEIFEEEGLLGCINGKSDLSTKYKEEITDVILQKHSKHTSQSHKAKSKKTRK